MVAMEKHIKIAFIIIFIMFASSSAHASPSVFYKDGPTLVFTMWDVVSDRTYIINLNIDVLEFNSDPRPFEFNILDLIKSKQGKKTDITTLKNFRWSVVGAITGEGKKPGYVASYNNSKPYASKTFWIKQRIQRWSDYLDRPNYSEGPNEVLIKESGDPGHYINLWQGNFNGLSESNLQARVGLDEPMEIW